jgi:hypothetical protein
LPIFDIVRVSELLPNTLKGGTTRPLLVLGEDGNVYVLKLFSIKDASQRPYTVAEVFANVIAKELNLNVPNAVLMEVPKQLIDRYKEMDPEIYEILISKDLSKPSFASIYHDGLPLYSPSMNDRHLEIDEFESIYAFDMLIINSDRRKLKPNILRSNHYLLIDHEKAFEGSKIILKNFESSIIPYFHLNHLFYDLLCKREKRNTNSVTFATFTELFRSINEMKLKTVIEECVNIGYSKTECYEWFDYIVKIKKNYSKFATLLKESIK